MLKRDDLTFYYYIRNKEGKILWFKLFLEELIFWLWWMIKLQEEYLRQTQFYLATLDREIKGIKI